MHRTAGLRLILVTLVFAGTLGWVDLVQAAGGGSGYVKAPFTPIQFALGPPGVQIFTDSTPVYGLSLSLLYGEQDRLYGLGFGLFSDAGDLGGIQLGLGNQVFHHLYGMQIGLANSADTGSGVQIGLWNRSHSMKGLQLGLINFNDEGLLPIMPFFNIGLGGDDAH